MVNKLQRGVGRRRFIASGAAVVGAVAATSGVAHAFVPSVAASVPVDDPMDAAADAVDPVDAPYGAEDPDEAVESLLGLSAGMRVGPFLIERVAKRDGAARIEAKGRGARFRVDILRRSASPRALAETDDLSLYLCNQGRGNSQTDETCGVGVLTIAKYLRVTKPEVPEYLLSYDERRSNHPTRERGLGRS